MKNVFVYAILVLCFCAYGQSAMGQSSCNFANLADSAKFAEFIYTNTHYPLIDYVKGIEGTAIYQFETDSVGRITNLQLDSTSGSSSLDREAQRLIYNTPIKRWANNKQISISITFKLDENIIYDQGEIEEKPEFPGGEAEMIKFLSKNLQYPIEVAEMAIQGKILCGFIVEKNGAIQTIEIVRPLDRYLDAEAIRVIARMPRWKAGKKEEKFVRTYCIFPIVFKLQSD
jgi:TonB family protein